MNDLTPVLSPGPDGRGLYVSLVSVAGLAMAGLLALFGYLLQYRIAPWIAGPWALLPALPFYLASGIVLSQIGLVLLSSVGPWANALYFGTAYKPVVRFFPMAMLLGRLLGQDEFKLRRSFLDLNNEHVRKLGLRLQPSEILLLLPHCLQCTECDVRVTGLVSHCKRCGRCLISSLLDLSDQTQVPLAVATGGTLARRIVKEKRCRAVVAVACERDLAEGILDTYPLPAYGIVNDRPFGPCFNTQVDLGRVATAIQTLLAGERPEARG